MADSLDTAIQNTIQNFVKTVTGFAGNKVIWAFPNIKRPAPPYISLNIIAGPRKDGNSEIRHTGIQDEFRKSFRKLITLSINVFANDEWLSTIEDIVNGTELEAGRSILRQGGIAVHSTTDPLDVTGLLNDQFEGRGQVDMFMTYNKDVVEDIGQVEDVQFSGLISNEDTLLTEGQNTSVVTDKLIDEAADFVTDGVEIGNRITNRATGIAAGISNVLPTELELDTDIFTKAGIGYAVRSSTGAVEIGQTIP